MGLQPVVLGRETTTIAAGSRGRRSHLDQGPKRRWLGVKQCRAGQATGARIVSSLGKVATGSGKRLLGSKQGARTDQRRVVADRHSRLSFPSGKAIGATPLVVD